MSVATITHGINDEFPLIIGVNRDGFIDNKWIIEEQDRWFGYSHNGWVVITLELDWPKDAFNVGFSSEQKSIAKLVSELVACGNHSNAAKLLKNCDPKEYAPTMLVFGRPGAVFTCVLCPGVEIHLGVISDNNVVTLSNGCPNRAIKHNVREGNVAFKSTRILKNDTEQAIVDKIHSSLKPVPEHVLPGYEPFAKENLFGYGTKREVIILVPKQGDTRTYEKVYNTNKVLYDIKTIGNFSIELTKGR